VAIDAALVEFDVAPLRAKGARILGGMYRYA
jgi:hypothetical protein